MPDLSQKLWRITLNTEELLGKRVRNIHNGDVGTVHGIRAHDLDGTPAVYVEIPVVVNGKKYIPAGKVWNIKEIELLDANGLQNVL